MEQEGGQNKIAPETKRTGGSGEDVQLRMAALFQGRTPELCSRRRGLSL